MNWLDRLLMLLEILILLKMLRMDTINSKAIQQFLQSRTDWYSRRAQLKNNPSQPAAAEPSQPTGPAENGPENATAPATEPGLNETVVVMQEASNEQIENQ
jgi:hypothetical protein